MSTDNRWQRLICLTSFLLLTLLGSMAWANSDLVPMSPKEMHRILAEGKIAAFEHRAEVASIPPSVVDVSGYDATYYRIELVIDEVAKQIDGEVTMHARARTDAYTSPTVYLHDDLTIDSVYAGGAPATWSRSNPMVYVTLNSACKSGDEFDVTIWYHGRPTTGGLMGFYFGTHDGHDGPPMISTLSEPYMAQSWWPCKDTPSDKADSVDMIVTVNSDLYAVSNGVLRDSVDNGDGTTTYSWHEGYPITTYLVSLAITDYARFDLWYHYGPGDADSMPVRFYSYPERLDLALRYWPVTVNQIDFFADIFGEYPFLDEKYGMAHFTWGGAMEHQTVTSATGGDFGFNEYLVAHELAHQWYGDLITCRNWHHIWMNEGFASYAEALWAEHRGGANALRNYMNSLNYYGGGRIYIDDTNNVWEIFSTRVYDKGAWVLHMLRGVIGDSAFFALLQEYYHHPDHFHKDVITEEFRDLAESVSGAELDEFFEDWIYGYYFPRYAFSWMSEPYQSNFYRVYVHIRQLQTTTPQVFDMPIDLAFNGLGGDPVYTVWNTEREQDYVFEVPLVPTSIGFDQDDWILCTVTSEAYGLNLIDEALATGTQYTPYFDSLVAKGGTPPYQFSVTSGDLPQGLVLHSETGVIDGAPLTAGAATVTIRVTDAGPASYKDKALTVNVGTMDYRPGDQNGDLVLDALDLADLIDHLFAGEPPPTPVNAADLNADCQADALDMAFMIDHLFAGGPLPQPGCIE